MPHKVGMVHTVTPALRGRSLEDQKLKTILSYSVFKANLGYMTLFLGVRWGKQRNGAEVSIQWKMGNTEIH